MDSASLSSPVSYDSPDMGKDPEVFAEFSLYIEKLSTVLNELKENQFMDESPTRKATESLEAELRRAKAMAVSPNYRSSPTKKIEDVTENLGRSLGLVLFASRDASIAGKGKIEALRKEMMNVGRFSCTASTDSKSEVVDDVETDEEIEESEDEIVEVDGIGSSVEDVVLQLKCGDDEQLKVALLGLRAFISEGKVTSELVDDEGVISILLNRLGATETINRVTIIQVLRSCIALNDGNKDKMAEVGYLTTLVKSLMRDDEDEKREAVGLLSALSDVSDVKRRLGRIQGCIVMLVAIFNGGDRIASRDAEKLLNALSSNTQNALHMAEAGYFKPLVQYLKEGSDMSKILMATALSRMELQDETRASIGKDGAIEALVKMFKDGKFEAKLSSLNALRNLSTLNENTRLLLSSGILTPILQLLFSVTSVFMSLREPASAILAKISQSDSIIVNRDIALQMLSLLNLSSPVIQCHLLDALNSIASHPKASKVRRKMRENGSINLLLPFLSESGDKIRTRALSLIFTLSNEPQENLAEHLKETYFSTIVNILSTSQSDAEKALAAGILSNLPVSDKKTTEILKKANLLPILLSIMGSKQTIFSPVVPSLDESIAGILIRFTISSDKKLQLYSAEHGIIPALVNLLSSGTIVAKCKSAISLAQLSENTLSFKKSRSKWLCVPPSPEALCEVHNIVCSSKNTLCLVKAGAVAPLIQILEGGEREADEAVLSALETLLVDDIWENGSKFFAKISGIEAIIKLLEFGSVEAQEKSVWILERIFRVQDHRMSHAESAKAVLIEIAQTGEPKLKPTFTKLLAELELAQAQ